MIIEHTFVTTLEAADAFALANECLSPKGFTVQDGKAGRSQQWRRGKSAANKSRGVLKLPQSLRMEFDRGRINLAACIENDPRRKKRSEQLMLAYAESLESLLADHHQPVEAFAGSDSVETSIRRSERNRRIAAIAAIVLIGGGIGGALLMAARGAQNAPARPRQQLVTAPRILPNSQTRRLDQLVTAPPPGTPITPPPHSTSSAKPGTKPPPQVTVRRAPTTASKPDER